MPKVQYITRDAMKPLLEPYGLSEAVKSAGLLHLAGQTGMSEQHRIVEGGLKAQALQAFRNIKAIVELAGGDAANLTSLTWYLAESPRSFMEDATDVMTAQHEILPGIAPASTAVRVRQLLTPEILVEIQAVAAL
jgi:2-iminobutanoate/2-iminopropanoate deaminase